MKAGFRRMARVAGALATMTVALSVAAEAQATLGDLEFQECFSGETATAAGACTSNGTTTPTGLISGLSNPVGVAVSPDGEHVYATASGDDSVALFDRDQATGALTYLGCVSANTNVVACTTIAVISTGDGQDTGLNEPRSPVFSGNGEFLYVVSPSDDAVTTFSRDSVTGTLSWLSCVTTGTTTPCTGVPASVAGGANTGMDDPQAIAVLPNSLYVVSAGDDAITHFGRVAATGAISYVNCRTTEVASGPVGGGGSGACASVGVPAADGVNTGLERVSTVAVSPDGRSLYLTSFFDHAVTRFSRNLANGALVYRNCITGDSDGAGSAGTNACDETPDATPNANSSGLGGVTGVVVSPDGANVYATMSSDHGVTRFERDAANGAISFVDCISGDTGAGSVCSQIPGAANLGSDSGVGDPFAPVVSPDGRSLYLAGSGDDSVAGFDRDSTGALAFRGCVTGETASAGACESSGTATAFGTDSGLDQIDALALSPNGKTIYGAAAPDASIIHLNREQPPETQIDSPPLGTTTDDTPTFSFSSPEQAQTLAGFECSLDGGPFTACASPLTTPSLGDAPHTFAVQARDTFGIADPIPAAEAFTVDAIADPAPPADPATNPPADTTPPDPTTPDPDPVATDTEPPKTKITKHPKKTVKTGDKKAKVTFKFSSSESASTFECKRDKGEWKNCSSAKKYNARKGKHTFRVRATDAAGNVDATPAKREFEVKRKG